MRSHVARSLLFVGAFYSLAFLMGGEVHAETFRVYFGTYTRAGASQGIYTATFDSQTGAISAPELAAETKNPSFLAIHPSRRWLYSVGELDKGGAVNAFAIDSASGKLTLLNQQSSYGAGPCHVSVDPSGRSALVANYGGGSCGALAIKQDGSLGSITAPMQHTGSSVNKGRQASPHAHSINVDPAGKFAFCADLGLDKVMIYRLDAPGGTLAPNDPPSASVAPGAGPRHFAFHPTGRWAYVINEMGMTITAFDYDAAAGRLTEIQTVTTLPAGTEMSPKYSTAEVVVHPSGKFAYGSNRGHNTIASFAIDPKTGKLTPTGHQGAGVKTPRNFNVDPTGNFVLVGNQDGDSVLVFRVNPADGTLQPTEHSVKVGAPVCIKFMPL